MANLRTNNLSGEGGINAIRGSLFFNSDYPTSSNNGLDSITVPAGSDFAYGTGDFTFEAYVWMDSFASDTRLIFSQTVSGTNYILFGITTSGQVTTILGHSNQVTSTGTIALNSWNHVAVSRSSGTVKVFVNGVASSGSSITTDLNDQTRIPTIGKYTHSTQLAWKGYISNFRICKGHAVYTTDFIPPTSELKAHYLSENDKTVLLCCQDSDNPLQEATGKTITGYGRYADSSVELVTNHSFNNGTTGWTLSDANEGSMTVTDGSLVLTNDDSSDPPVYAWQAVTTVVGQTYVLKVHFSGGTGTPGSNLAVYLHTSSSFGGDAGGFMTADSVSGNGIKTMKFTSQHATTYVLVRVNVNSASTAIFSAVSIKAADYGDSPKLIPPYGVDAGNTFNGAISMNSPSWMYFPTGKTGERGGTRACWFRGYVQTGANDNTIDFSEMSSKGNAQDFADTLTSNRQAGALGSSTRGVFGGQDGGSNVIEFVTFSTQSNSLDFGDFTAARAGQPATASDGTRGLFFGGYAPNIANANIIEYITIASLGNGADFGDLTDKPSEPAGCASPTRGIKMGGRTSPSPSNSDVIDYTTIQTLGNATDFGNLTVARFEAAGASSTTRGVNIAGYSYSPNTGRNTIDYITIASTGDAQDFGDLTAYTQSWQGGSGSNNVIIAHGIGYNNSARDNRIDFITIATTGDSVDYGDLTNQRSQIPCATNGHGGLS